MSENDNESKSETDSDLKQLHDILYGHQARVTAEWLNELETRLETLNTELRNELEAQVSFLSRTAQSQSLSVEEILAQANSNIRQRLDQQISDLRQQLAGFRAESRQRDVELRQEILKLGAMLNKQQTEHVELGDLLVELGRRLKESRKNSPDRD
jgi:hypothetical protein